MNKLIAACLLAFSLTVGATENAPPPATPTVQKERWVGDDKTLHWIAGSITGIVVTAETKKPFYGTLAGCGLGAAKELYDMSDRTRHTPSFKDFTVTCLGAGIASYGSNWLITRHNGTNYVAFNYTIK